jgi:PAS domain S-box-containing protein
MFDAPATGNGPKHRPRAYRLSARLSLLVVLAITLTSVLALSIADNERRDHVALVRTETAHLVWTAALLDEDLGAQTRLLLAEVASLRSLQNADWPACRRELAAELASRPVYANLSVAAPDGAIVCSARPVPAAANVSTRPSFVRAMSGRVFSFGGYAVDPIAGRPVLEFGAPAAAGSGVPPYVVFADVDLRWFSDLAARIQLPPGATFTMFDAAGTVIARYPDPSRWNGRMLPYADVVPAVARGPVTIERAGLDGVRRLHGVMRLSMAPAYTDTYLSVGVPVSSVLADAQRRFLMTVGVIGLGGLFAALVALGGAVLFVQRPIDSLAAAARRVAAGDLRTRSGRPPFGGEFEPMLHTFDDMASALESRTAALEDTEAQYRALVEQSLVGVSVLDAETFLYVNDALAAIFGYHPDEMVGRLGPADVAQPEDWPLVAGHIRRRLEGRDAVHYAFRGRRKDGAAIDVEVFGRRIVYHGRPAVMSTVLDVTDRRRAAAEQERRMAEWEAFHGLSVRLRAARTARDIYPIVAEQAMHLLRAAHVTLSLHDTKREKFVRVHSAGVPFGNFGPEFEAAGSYSERVIRSGTSHVTGDMLSDRLGVNMDRPQFAVFGPRVIVPLRTQEEPIGALMAVRLREPAGQAFTENDVRLLESIAEIGGIAIRRAELAESLARRVATLTALYAGSERLAASLDPEHLAADVVRTCVEAFGARMASIGYIGEGGAALMAAHYPPDSEGLQAGGDGPIDFREIDPDTVHVVRDTASPIVLSNLTAPREHPGWARAALVAGMRSAAIVPLVSGAKPFGFLAVYSDRTEWFTTERVEFFTAYAHQAAAALQNARFFQAADRHLHEMEALNEIDRAISGSFDLSVMLSVLLDRAVSALQVDAADVLVLDPRTQTLRCAASRGYRSDPARQLSLRLGEGAAARVVMSGRRVTIGRLNGSAESVCGGHVAGEGFVSYHAMPLIAKGAVTGVLEVYRRSPSTPAPEWYEFFEALAGQAAMAIDNVALFEDLRRVNAGLRVSYDQSIEGWARALDLREKQPDGHSLRIADLSVALARAMGIAGADVVHLRRGALLHDIGTMGVPDGILSGAGPLTDEESAAARRHPAYARELLAPIADLRPAVDVPYSRYERWDGTGFPDGLRGEQIPLAARIVAVVHEWEALRSERPGRPTQSVAEITARLRGQSGRRFDPEVVDRFIALLEGRGDGEAAAAGAESRTS